MLFWDASAVVSLVVAEAGSRRATRLARSDPNMAVWWGTPVECLSALSRAERAGRFDSASVDGARRSLDELRRGWTEVAPAEEVRDQACVLVLRHRISAADALQLGAALAWTEGRPLGFGFVTLDRRLASAARQEGFTLPLPTEAP